MRSRQLPMVRIFSHQAVFNVTVPSRLRMPALAAVACGAVLALPCAARATDAHHNGAIAYIGKRAGERVLYVRHGRRYTARIRMGGTAPADPAWSPLGRRLAFDRPSSVGRDVWVMAADGRDLRRLTPLDGREEDPTWSPKGDEIAYAAGSRGSRDIWAIGLDGNGLRQLTRSPRDDSAPTWSHNTIVFVRHNPRSDDLYSMSSDGTGVRRLTAGHTDEDDPALSPDARTIAFVRTGAKHAPSGIYLMNADGSGKPRLIAAVRGREAAPAFSPDGRRVVFSAGRGGRRELYEVKLYGHHRRPHAITTQRTDGESPAWQPTGANPVIAAAGDIACSPTDPHFFGGLGDGRRCAEMATSDLLLKMDLWSVLVLGDEQYPDGSLAAFQQSFAPSWGRLGSLMKPVPGNHEYVTPGAAGYYGWFGSQRLVFGQGADPSRGYYSFDIGDWHLIALNGNCDQIPGGCGPGSPEDTWLQADLAAHPAACTLAFLHQPPQFDDDQDRNEVAVTSLWQTLYDGGADVVLDGHEHTYERYLAMNGTGGLDAARGIRQFTVGVGGKSLNEPGELLHHNYIAVAQHRAYGVLTLTLRPHSYAWRFVPVPGMHFHDRGASVCH